MGGTVQLIIPAEKLEIIIAFLHSMVQRGNSCNITDFCKASTRGVYQLDTLNNWNLIEKGKKTYTLRAKYEHQEVVEAIAMTTQWHFVLDGFITSNGKPARTIERLMKGPSDAMVFKKNKERNERIARDLL